MGGMGHDFIMDAKLVLLSTDERSLDKDHFMTLSKFNTALDLLDKGVHLIDFACSDASKHSYKANINHVIGVYKDILTEVVLKPDLAK